MNDAVDIVVIYRIDSSIGVHKFDTRLNWLRFSFYNKSVDRWLDNDAGARYQQRIYCSQ